MTTATTIEELLARFSYVLSDEQMIEFNKTLRGLATAMLANNWRYLSQVLSHGRGWNDNSKRAFCEAIGKTEDLTAKAMDAYIAEYCGVSVQLMKATLEYDFAVKQLKEAEVDLLDFKGGDECIEEIELKIKDGMDKVEVINRKTYLLNTSTGHGLYLRRKVAIEYAKARLKVIALNEAVIFENKSLAKKQKQAALLNVSRTLRNAPSLIEWLDNSIRNGFNALSVLNGVTYLCNNNTGQGYPLNHSLLVDYARAECILCA